MIFPEYEYQISNPSISSGDYASFMASAAAATASAADSTSQFAEEPFYLGSSLPLTTTTMPPTSSMGISSATAAIASSSSSSTAASISSSSITSAAAAAAAAAAQTSNGQIPSPNSSSPYGVVGSESENEFTAAFMSTFGQVPTSTEDYTCEPLSKKRKAIYMPPLRETSGTYTTPESLLNGVTREALRGVPSSELEECEKYLQNTYELTQGQVDTLHKQIKLAKNREAVRKSRVKVQNKLSSFELENIELKKKILLLENEIQKLRTHNAVLATENNALKRKHE